MNKIIENLILGLATIVLISGISTPTAAQTPRPAPTPGPRAAPVVPPRPKSQTRSTREEPPEPPATPDHGTSEKFIKVDSSVKLQIDCIKEATIKINGWDRGEVRVFIQDGSKFGFKVQQKSPKTGDPVWIKVVGMPSQNKYAGGSECISADEIEIDVPSNSTISIQGRETTSKIDSVRKVDLKTIGGDISLRNISGGISASSNRGDITVEESHGAIVLESTSGNILVFDVGPSDIGDIFKASTTNGAISIQEIDHRQVNVNSITGSVAYNGEILDGGSYSFATSRGSIRLAIPANSACRVNATYGYGSFSSDIPFKVLTENISEGPIKNVIADVGKGGDATLKLTTNNGSITIKKQ